MDKQDELAMSDVEKIAKGLSEAQREADMGSEERATASSHSHAPAARFLRAGQTRRSSKSAWSENTAGHSERNTPI